MEKTLALMVVVFCVGDADGSWWRTGRIGWAPREKNGHVPPSPGSSIRKEFRVEERRQGCVESVDERLLDFDCNMVTGNTFGGALRLRRRRRCAPYNGAVLTGTTVLLSTPSSNRTWAYLFSLIQGKFSAALSKPISNISLH